MNSDHKFFIAITSFLVFMTGVFYCQWLCSRLDALHQDVVEIKLLLYKPEEFEMLHSLGKLNKSELDLIKVRLDTLIKMKKFGGTQETNE